MASTTRPQFVEVAAEPINGVHEPRVSMDFGHDYPAGPRVQAAPMEYSEPTPESLFSEPSEAERDLDVPAFMRRAKF